ncbi:hypothetical protein [Rhizobium sp. NFR07]|uniref:hypothetical protein n=1 Tax=Rhizobium sp. NFR07 TaxID=1566262 RepID=UPI001160AE45|nr:hypothetical protein [Rhizobium sp. NFR07]
MPAVVLGVAAVFACLSGLVLGFAVSFFRIVASASLQAFLCWDARSSSCGCRLAWLWGESAGGLLFWMSFLVGSFSCALWPWLAALFGGFSGVLALGRRLCLVVAFLRLLVASLLRLWSLFLPASRSGGCGCLAGISSCLVR